ncbi:hypothetical protein FQR65_LT05855 [Abscondita terminalis]|nr:hypothetical protein FQR65_LT05855 [Abscondita terminalis]
MYDLEGKVAIVTGGAAGIGYAHVKELLKNGVKGVSIIDVNEVLGNKVLDELKNEFGPSRVIFVAADVSNKIQLRDAFEKTVAVFQQLDIIINNAGITNEIDWEKSVAINFVAVIDSTLLAIDHYFPKYKSGNEGVVLNTASMAALKLLKGVAVYASTKCGVIGFTQQAAITFSDKGVRIIAICPDATETSALTTAIDKMRKEHLDSLAKTLQNAIFQSPEEVALAAIKLIKTADSGSIWTVIEGKLEEMDKLPVA